MASNSDPSPSAPAAAPHEGHGPLDRDDAHNAHNALSALNALEADREQLARNGHVPRLLLAAYGGIGAWFVAAAAGTEPGAGYEAPDSYWLAIVAVFVVGYLVQRETGVRFRAMGGGATVAMIGILALCMGLYSVSLGLVSLGATWAVAAMSILAFAGTAVLAGVAYRSAFRKLGRG